MLPESFEHVLKTAQTAGSLTPAWKKFIKTKFFVAILRSPDDDPKNFLLCISRHPADGKPVVIISEVRDRIDQHLGDGVVAVSGADIVRRMDGQSGILVELHEGVFNVSKKRAAWLLSGIQVTQARVATRKVLMAAAPAAPLPVLQVRAGAAASGASAEPAPAVPARRSLEALQALAAAHVPKTESQVTQFFDPPEWKEDPSPAAVQVARLRALATSMPAMLAVIVVGLAAAFYLLVGEVEPDVPAIAAAPQAAGAAPARTASPSFEAALPAAAAPALTRFSPADNSFSVSVPGLPEELELTPDQVEQMGELRMHQYKLVSGSRIYTMQATDYGDRLPEDPVAALDGMQASIVGQDGTLVSARQIAMRGATGREVRVRLGNGAVRAARFVFIGSKFCMVAVVAANGQKSASDIDAYLNSFQLN